MSSRERLELVRAAGDEARADRRRRAEQVEQQPRIAPEVANQREVVVVRALIGQRKVVMDARDHLHPLAVSMRETCAVHALRAPDVGAPIAADRNGGLLGQPARHARAPQQLVAERPVDRLMDRGELLDAGIRARVHAGDQLELRLAEVRRHQRMRERRAECRRMRRRRERAVGTHAQALFFDAAPETGEHVARQRSRALDEHCFG